MSDNEQKHQQRMAKKKAIVDEKIAKAQEERGVLILLKGNGKGKSSSALGTMARSLGYGKKCAVIQFIKGRNETGEQKFFQDHPLVDWHVMGHGFTWETQNREQDILSSKEAWLSAKALLADDSFDLVVLDELTYLLHYDYLEEDQVLDAIMQRPDTQHLVVTGRGASDSLIEIADTVSDIKEIKHAFKRGIKAQKGLEF